MRPTKRKTIEEALADVPLETWERAALVAHSRDLARLGVESVRAGYYLPPRRPKAQAERFEALAGAVRALEAEIAALRKPDLAGRAALGEELATHHGEAFAREALSELQRRDSRLREVLRAAGAASARLAERERAKPAARGRNPETAARTVVLALLPASRELTGGRATSGRFEGESPFEGLALAVLEEARKLAMPGEGEAFAVSVRTVREALREARALAAGDDDRNETLRVLV